MLLVAKQVVQCLLVGYVIIFPQVFLSNVNTYDRDYVLFSLHCFSKNIV